MLDVISSHAHYFSWRNNSAIDDDYFRDILLFDSEKIKGLKNLEGSSKPLI